MPSDVGNHGPPSVEVTLQVDALREDVTVTASPNLVEDVRRAGQPVNIIDSEDIATRVNTVVAQAVEGETGVQPAADEPDDGRRVRARADREQGQRVRRRRPLFERRAARRRQHVPRSDRAGALETIEILRGPSSAQYGSDALGGSIQFLTRPPALGVAGGPRWGGSAGGERRNGASLWRRRSRSSPTWDRRSASPVRSPAEASDSPGRATASIRTPR